MENILRKDREWQPVEGHALRVLKFTPFARVEGGQVTGSLAGAPYASVTLECKKLPPGTVGFITHKEDFSHLWAAFMGRGVEDDEEVVIFWIKSHLKGAAKLFSAFMPRLCVMICSKGACELMNDPDFRPELSGEARFNAERPIIEWKPAVMD